MFSSAARAPITAVLIIFELTGDYHVILPLMFAIVVATALSNALTRDTLYPSSSAVEGATWTPPAWSTR